LHFTKFQVNIYFVQAFIGQSFSGRVARQLPSNCLATVPVFPRVGYWPTSPLEITDDTCYLHKSHLSLVK